MFQSYRATRLVVDEEKILKNIEAIQKYIGGDVKIMPIVKANGYGSHINEDLRILNRFDVVGVSLVDEAVRIRKIGYEKDIFVLYPPVINELPAVISSSLIINGSNIDILLKLNELSKGTKIKIHLEIETGMGRTGVQFNELNNFLDRAEKLENIMIVGTFTHFASSSKDLDFTKIQISRFEKALKIFKDRNIDLKYIHVCNSGAIFNFKNNLYNLVRIGLLLLGYYPNSQLKNIIKLYPSLTLKTKINYLKEINVGDTVGYNKNFIAKRKSKIATIPFGFGDGLIGLETGNSYVIINGKKAFIIAICMDNMMIDVTDIEDINYETDVFIWDNEILTVETIAEWIPELCSYEILCSLSERIPRDFVGEER